jgi:hypothetical protein
LDQAKGAMDIAGKMREHQQNPAKKSRGQQRADAMDATAIVKKDEA